MILRTSAAAKWWRRLIYVVLAAGLLLVAQHTRIAAGEPKMTKQTMNMNMRSICVGRFLLDVPVDAEVSYRTAFLSGWDVATDPDETDDEFLAKLRAKEEKWKNERNEHELVSLEKIVPVSTAEVAGKIFVFGRQWTYGYENGKRVDENFPSMNAYVRTRHVSFDFTREISDDSDLAELLQLTGQVRARGEGEIPTQPGFCFERGIVLDPLNAEQHEGVTLFVGLKGHPDVSIVLFMRAGITEASTLLGRAAEGKETFSPGDRARFLQLRAGTRTLAGMKGQELAEKVMEHNGTSGHSFMWESLHNDKSKIMTPLLTFEMSTGHGQPGEPVSSTLSDEAALALWDKMTSSLRVRPTQTPAADAPTLPSATVGMTAMGGGACPANGWWRCTDGEGHTDVRGGRVQYLRAGQVIPQAVLLPDTSAWQKLSGVQPTLRSDLPSSWRLVDRRKNPRGPTSLHIAVAANQPASGRETPASDTSRGHTRDTDVGTELESGKVCSASGWWQCLETAAVDGTRWFQKGVVLPPATKSASLTIIDKLKGMAEFVRVAANWRLVRVTDADNASLDAPENTDVLPPSPTSNSGQGPSDV